MFDSTDGELVIFKNSFTLIIVSWITYLWIDSKIFSLFWVLLFLDYLVGISVAIKYRKFTKREAVEWVIWKALLLIVPLSLGILWKINWYDTQSVLSAVFWAFAIAEVYSIFWWIYEYRTWKKHKEVDLVALIIQFMLWILRTIFDKIITKQKQNDGKNSNWKNE